MTVWTEDDSRNLTVAFVARDGHRMRLTGDDRAEAIRVMTARGVDRKTIAYRLHIDIEALRRWALRHNITLPPATPPQPWWVGVACPSDTTAARRRQKQAQRARATTRSSRP